MKRTMWIEFLGSSILILLGQWIPFQVCFYLTVGMVVMMNLSVLIDLEELNEALKEKKAIKKADERELKSAKYNIDDSMIA